MTLIVENCPFCTSTIDWERMYLENELIDIAQKSEDFYYPSLCCEQLTSEWILHRDIWARDTLQRCAFAAESNNRLRSLVQDSNGKFHVDYCLTIKLLQSNEQRMAKEFIKKYHMRNNNPPCGWRWGMGIYNSNLLLGIIWVGRPVSRKIDQSQIVEINRLCIRTDIPKGLEWKACSQGYGAATREAERRGFSKIITYTGISEAGTTLRAAGWQPIAQTTGGSWHRASRPRNTKTNIEAKIRWERSLKPRTLRSPQNTSNNTDLLTTIAA